MSKHPQNNNNQQGNLVVQHQKTEMFSGPLPHPDILQRFNEIVPGAAERILKMAENQFEHRTGLEKKVIDSDIVRSKWGQILGFIIAIVGLGGATLIAIYGNAIAGTILGGGTLVALVSVFMYGTNERKKEREEKSSEKSA